ncbi:hypothetical protein LSTR_LSTR006160 [Laodelphax striatellus]|uniref:Dolichyl-diphosphooligosaccharide--protein glycosyltransferase subunit 1 n=1 Tax=Laodelphax striatellus TaxID=195883 RepID=A0A482XQC6_LAOST|nr:hypothetical protein LSTR_LSTR006160 [Laodelphax striatellus]
MNSNHYILCSVLVLFIFPAYSLQKDTPVEKINSDIVIRTAQRTLDISVQLVKQTIEFTVENTGTSAVNKFLFTVDPSFEKKVTFVSGSDQSGASLDVDKVNVVEYPGKTFWLLKLKEAIKPKQQSKINVLSILMYTLKPFPSSIALNEEQFVQFTGNHYVYSPYKILKQKTVVETGTRKIESYSKLMPTSLQQSDGKITYGPYAEQSPFTENSLTVHYSNNSPFLSVPHLDRLIEVSHWGNIAVEENIELVNTGARLKGPFSRVDSIKGNSISKFTTFLPAAAYNVYYRDEIGNVSTSSLKVFQDTVELNIRPRFPLFGGWRTSYILGYNVPSYEYLYSLGDQFKLKMRIVDHVFDNMIIDEAVVKIILPERSYDIELSTPFPVTRLDDESYYSYLDAQGRPVVVLKMTNIVENHIQDFELNYKFSKVTMIFEPLLVCLVLFIVFICAIIYFHADFTISSNDEEVETVEEQVKEDSSKPKRNVKSIGKMKRT